jgi:hypothetical protein
MPGLVVTVSPLPDPVAMASWDTKVYTTIVRLMENQPGLRPGITAQVEILINELDNVLTVPIETVLHFEGKPHVTVKKPDGSFERREVALGETSDNLVEVKNGLKSGELVVLNPVALLRDSEKRQMNRTPQPPAAKPAAPRRQ